MAKTRSNKRPAQSGSSGRNAKKIKAEREAGLVEELQQKTEEAGNEDKFVDEVMDDRALYKSGYRACSKQGQCV